MPSKTLVWLGIIIGSTIGSFVPILFGASFLSYSSVVGSGVGAIVGLFIASKIEL